MPGVIPEKVNEEQRRAIEHGSGPLLIVAGAGTGKTTVVTERMAHLIMMKNMPAESVLALTFTDKAAGEMQDRIERVLPFGYVNLWISTFHSFCQRILQAHALDIGLSTDFKLLNETEQWLLIREHLTEFDLDYYRPFGNPTKFISALVKHFARIKDDDISSQEYLKYAKSVAKRRPKQQRSPAERDEARRLLEAAKAFATYNDLLRRENAVDFGDLILFTLQLFRERPAILERYQQQFQYILVDEFQDTNWAQYELVKKLAEPRKNITVVGDDDQSIYKFRGASVANIFEFRRDFPDCDVVVLTKNYRNRQNILDLSYRFIRQNNPDRLEAQTNNTTGLRITKQLQAQRKGDGTIELIHVASQELEAQAVAQRILERKKNEPERSWSDFCVLVRANDHAEPFFREFERQGLPSMFFAARGLFRKPLVLDLLAYLRLLDNYREGSAVYRVLTIPIFHIAPEDIVTIAYEARKRTWSLFEALQHAESLSIREPTRRAIRILLDLVNKHTTVAQTRSVGEVVIRFLDDSGYLKEFTKKDDARSHERVMTLNQFFKTIEVFQRGEPEPLVRNFLAYFDHVLESGDVGTVMQDVESGPDAIRIMTIHSAKGLEFPYVFLGQCVDQRFPSIERRDPIEVPDALIRETLPTGDAHLQEERRLMYVAMTRARDGVFFTAAEDYGGVRKKKPSRFLYELRLLEPPAKTEPQLQSLPLATPKQAPVAQKDLIRSRQPEKKYSFTKLSSYQTCPWQYRYAFVLQVPRCGSYTLSYGQTMHKTLYQFFHLWQEREEGKEEKEARKSVRGQGRSASTVPRVSLDELLTIYDRIFIHEWYETKRQKQEYYEKGKSSLTRWYAKHAKRLPRVLRLEHVFNLKVDQFLISGAIDRIDTVNGKTKKPTVKIVDYKTGRYREKFETQDQYQLLIYALAAQDPHILGAEVAELEYYFLDENKSLTMKPTPKDAEKTKKWISETIAKIQSGDFRPTPGIVCKFCDFREICEHRAY